MKSKVIAVRLPIATIAHCVDLLDKVGVNTSVLPLSTCVRHCLESAISIELKQGSIELRSDESANLLVENWKKDDPEVFSEAPSSALLETLRSNIPKAFSEELRGPDQDPTDEETDAVHMVHNREGESLDPTVKALIVKMQEESEPDIAQEETEISEDVETAIKSKDELFTLKFLPFSEIKQTSPKDRLVLGFEDSKENADEETSDLYQRCIELIYLKLPADEWGTERAQKLVEDLFEAYK